MAKKGFIIVLAGPTGSGESTITKELIKQLPRATRIVTTTSRPKRLKEQDGLDYNFISKEAFQKQIKDNEFLEYTHIENRDVYYGTKKDDFEQLLKTFDYVIFNCDVVGLKAIRKNYSDNYVAIFIMYDQINDIKQRLLKREPNMSPEELQMRLDNAESEAEERIHYDYVVINHQNKLEHTIKEVLEIIDQAVLDKK